MKTRRKQARHVAYRLVTMCHITAVIVTIK